MDTEIEQLKENMDMWVKEIRREIKELMYLPQIVNENINNVQDSYQLIYELKNEVEDLKEKLNAMRLIQIMSLKHPQQKILYPSEAGVL